MRCALGTGALAPLGGSGTALLTTYRRGGAAVATPVSIAVAAERAYFVTPADSGKAKRLAGCNRVQLAPCTVGGTRWARPSTGGPDYSTVPHGARPRAPVAHRAAVLELAALPATRTHHEPLRSRPVG
jgi:hypothetical protein